MTRSPECYPQEVHLYPAQKIVKSSSAMFAEARNEDRGA
jgi:hypothetical protein